MPKGSRLQSVTHNIMDHAVSGLGFLTPHVVAFCKASGRSMVEINLCPPSAALEGDEYPKPLALAASACQSKFIDILMHEGFQPHDVVSARLHFAVPIATDSEAFSCECNVQSTRGKHYRAAMDSDTYWSSKKGADPFDALRKLSHGG